MHTVHDFSIPLIIEVWQRDRQRSENTCLGVVKVPLSLVLRSPRSKFVVSIGVYKWCTRIWAGRHGGSNTAFFRSLVVDQEKMWTADFYRLGSVLKFPLVLVEW